MPTAMLATTFRRGHCASSASSTRSPAVSKAPSASRSAAASSDGPQATSSWLASTSYVPLQIRNQCRKDAAGNDDALHRFDAGYLPW